MTNRNITHEHSNKKDYNKIKDYDIIYSVLNEHIVNKIANICMDYLIFNIKNNEQHLYDKYHPHCIMIGCEGIKDSTLKFKLIVIANMYVDQIIAICG